MWSFLAAVRRLRRQGILGINERNASCILDYNPRSKFPIVDDKLRMHLLCNRIGVPSPPIYRVLTSVSMLWQLPRLLRGLSDFVIKPNRGSAGRGVLVITGRDGEFFVRHNGTLLGYEEIRQHLSDMLSGMYSLGGQQDVGLLQHRVQLHAVFEDLCYKGIPDIRVVVYQNQPVMAMLRLPTRASNGRANLHQGGIGVGINLASGRTHHAVWNNRSVQKHPDTKSPLVGFLVPNWNTILQMANRVAKAVKMGYLGVDIVLDAERGPLLLEANARPGLAIQIANNEGLIPRLREIDTWLKTQTLPTPVEEIPDDSIPVEVVEEELAPVVC